jgi:hypothetical protein
MRDDSSMRTRSWTDDDLRQAVATSSTWGQVARSLGLKADGGSSYGRIRSVATELGLDISHFLGRSWSKGTGSGRDITKARAAKRRWYRDNRQVYADRNRQRAKRNAQRLRVLKDAPCTDCDQRFPPCVMDFDHRDGEDKTGNISIIFKHTTWARVLLEVAKCDLVCANCHRIRTAKRAGWPGQDDGEWCK